MKPRENRGKWKKVLKIFEYFGDQFKETPTVPNRNAVEWETDFSFFSANECIALLGQPNERLSSVVDNKVFLYFNEHNLYLVWDGKREKLTFVF